MRRLMLLLMALCLASTLTCAAWADSDSLAQPELPEAYTSDDVDNLVARMGDEQARQLLIQELQRVAMQTAAAGDRSPSLQELFSLANHRYIEVAANLENLPNDFSNAFAVLAEGKSFGEFLGLLGVILLCFVVGFVLEVMFREFTSGFRTKLLSMPETGGWVKVWSLLLGTVPKALDLSVFVLGSILFVLIFFGEGTKMEDLLFTSALAAILTVRLTAIVSSLLISPKQPGLRMIPLNDQAAQYLHGKIILLASILGLAEFVVSPLMETGMPMDSLSIVIIGFGAAVILAMLWMVLANRVSVASAIRVSDPWDTESSYWLRDQFAGIWHVLATAYLLLVLLFWTTRVVVLAPEAGGGTLRLEGTLVVSFLIVPVFLLLSRGARWVTLSTVGVFRREEDESEKEDSPEGDEVLTQEEEKEQENRNRYIRMALRTVHFLVFAAVILWVIDYWGFQLPFAKEMVRAAFNVFVTLFLAHMIWGYVSEKIRKKLEEDMPEETEENKEDDEWGGAANLGRSHTLLPRVRSFVAVTLFVMVTMIILSSIGVNIGPLLAGAGVVGLALGFGAQKLVADVLSGIFFLIDDAFRVGEYIQAGSVSGSVENITLRNVMLRHHRGMLQIVPFSELGSVTNFMRGGIVVKFNLEFPYDTNIDKVRKIIKKVGKAMLQDEEIGQDFIQPVKSQGVRSVGDSVMTIRVKFTAQPGKHFVIRREAFKRITEALNKKDIYYAHKRVMVDIPPAPESQEGKPVDEQALKAAAAAALETVLNKEKEGKQEDLDQP